MERMGRIGGFLRIGIKVRKAVKLNPLFPTSHDRLVWYTVTKDYLPFSFPSDKPAVNTGTFPFPPAGKFLATSRTSCYNIMMQRRRQQ
jgi:hypothetical protein